MNEKETFLYLAYVLAGLIYALYTCHLAWRLRRARRELDALKAKLEASRPSGAARA